MRRDEDEGNCTKCQSIFNEIIAKGELKSISNRTHVKGERRRNPKKTSGKAEENLIIFEFA
jgi:hypothetical protein